MKSLLKKLLPKRCYDHLRKSYLALKSFYYVGLRYKCPCCGGHFRKFLPGGTRQRKNAQCPRCFSLERHRAAWLYLEDKTNLFKEDLCVLHLAPTAQFRRRFTKMANITYISTDIESPLAMVRTDIQSMSFADKTFDCIICYHVLEHVSDDRKAMKELLRVLKPHGWALIQSPVDLGLEHTFEDPSVVSPEETARLFGQDDHVRMYGRDFKLRLEDAGFTVSVEDYSRQLGEARVEQYGLVEGELIYFCLRNEQ